jgi:N-acetylglucosaminyldiphosphoundecaprenol N-acetyl-beta-D-mannosaminyltransferase
MPFEFIIHLLGALEKQKGSLFLLGQKKGELQTVEQNLRTSFPELRFVGRYNGYYPKELKNDIITAIKKAAPSLLLSGRGIPKKELWIFENLKQFNPGIFIWCGGCFDIFAGKRDRPSKVAWKSGVYRLPGLLIRPWRILRMFPYLYYGIRIILSRIAKN